jgi:hypothetical protein
MREPRLLAIIYIILVNVAAYGQAKPLWEPPKIGIQSIVEQPSGARDLVSKIMMGSFQLVLEETLF